jgi:RecG-like helicase
MKRNIALITGIASLFLLAFSTPTFAADPKANKEVTITGEGKCAKCSLKETEKCQNVIQTKEDGKTVTYYIAKNDVSDKFHKTVCQETKKVTATGKVKEVDGKKELTVTKIDLAKE